MPPCYLPPSVVGGDGFHSDGVQNHCGATCTGLQLTHNTIDARALYAGTPTGNSAPARGILYHGGPLTWWMALSLSLTLMIAAWLLLGAGLRRWVAAHSRRLVALSVALAVAAFVLLLTVWERAYPKSTLINDVRHGYWYEVVANRTTQSIPWWYLVAVLVVIAGVVAPSIVRNRRTAS